jgi:hypothetical protein
MRRVEITEDFALKLGRLRAHARHQGVEQAPKDEEPRLRLQDVEAIERELGVELTDPALAFVAAGVSLWGDGPLMLAKIVNTTMDVREIAVEQGMTEAKARRFMVFDDDSSGNYLAVRKGTRKDSDRFYFLDHEGGFDTQIPMSLSESIDRLLEELGAGTPSDVAPFRFTLVDEPAPPPRAVVVRHPKFGAGTVVANDGDYVTVAFAEAGTKRLKRSFVVFE